MQALRTFGQNTFSSLWIRNYRLYFIGQGISQVGTWMQVVGVGWLVLSLTGSGVALGTLLALRFTPLLIGGPIGGAIVDRFDKRRIVFLTQTAFAASALTLAILVATDLVQLWMLFFLTTFNGIVDTFDRPARQTFVHEMVGPENLRNAVTLNSTEVNLARAVGPLVAGALIAGVGLAVCFFINAISFVAVLLMIGMIRPRELAREERSTRPIGFGLFAEGLRYVRTEPLIRNILIVMAVIGTFSYEFQTTLPLFAKVTFGGDAADYAALLSAMGAGSVAGGLFAASRQTVAPHEFVVSAFLFGLSIIVTGFMPTLSYAVIGMAFIGFFSINLTSVGNTMVQLTSASHMRGRVMALWGMAIFGSTVVGAPIIGFIAQYASPRFALWTGGVAALAAAVYAASRMLERDQWMIVPPFIRIWSQESESELQKL